MTISEMHTQFRVKGQQMGLQLVNAILPSSIDAFLNEAIVDKVRSVLTVSSQRVFNDKQKTKVYMTDTSIAAINSLRTLYTKNTLMVHDGIAYTNKIKDNLFILTSAAVRYVSDGKYYKARIIDGDKLEDTLNDYCNGASKDYPIVSFYVNNNSDLTVRVDTDNVPAYDVEIRYIKKPIKVSYDNNIDCDLPEYLHYEIVELAVIKFQQSIQSTKHVVAKD